MLLDSFRASYLVSPSGGPLEQLKEIYLWPQKLPDGEHLLYLRWAAPAGRFQARTLRLSDFASKDLIEADSRVLYSPSTVTPGSGYLLYVRAGNLLAHPFDPRSLRVTGEADPVAKEVYAFAQTGAADFSVSDRGTIAYQSLVSRSQLMWVDRAGHQISAIGPANINVKFARVSPDGQRLATAIYDVERGQQDLWIFDVKTNSARRLTAEPSASGRSRLVAGFEDAGIHAYSRRHAARGSICAVSARRIRKKRCRPPIFRCRPTGPPMDASSLS